jgi:hypothetical protein
MMDIPTIDEWENLSREEMAAAVRPYHLSVKVALDGTRRHFLLSNPNDEGEILDFAAYAQFGMASIMNMIDLLFTCGFETVLVLNVWPPDVERRDDYLAQALPHTRALIMGEEPYERYRAWDAKVSLYGNYDINPIMSTVADELLEIKEELESVVQAGSRLLLWGYCGGRGLDEAIARSVILGQQLGRIPTEDEVRRACFPLGPTNLDVFIGGGWLRIGNADLPPVLNNGKTDIYSLSHLPLDLSEAEVRRILYDRLFLRYASSPETNMSYTMQTTKALKTYYDAHRNCILGTGHLVGPDLWYPDHKCMS